MTNQGLGIVIAGASLLLGAITFPILWVVVGVLVGMSLFYSD